MRASVGARSVIRFASGGRGDAKSDQIAIEEPLEIRVAGEPVAVTMRTPGDDARLAAGFLFAEGILRSLDDVGTIAHCGRPGEDGYGNVIDVTPASGASFDVERLLGARRGTLTTAACGVCGRKSIDDLIGLCGVLQPGAPVLASVLGRSPAALRERQTVFSRTGGTHAAAALDASGALLAAHEDVGRHNAVDKVVGALLYARQASATRTAAQPAILVVSGRASFEIIQKAAVAQIPIVASVSAPSSLAVDLAERVGILLAGFVRDDGFNVYSHPERLSPEQ